MQSRKRAPNREPARRAAVRKAAVWFDQSQALVIEGTLGLDQTVELLERKAGETDTQFEVRTVDEVIDEDRVVVSGPADARLEFERAYVAVTHRPDRLVDAEPRTPTSRT